ncbi:MAG TPA: GPW/gp25 family protein [Pyrinomonadaceae bacterium]|nr:GPW/gp25 family protein [Pyrinomonadaceae bacterium]
MDDGRLFRRGMAFPPRVGSDGRISWSEGEANVREAVQIILLTERNERLMLPEFGGGLGRYLFEPNNVATRHLMKDRIAKALARWEPRVAVESVEVEEDPSDPQGAVATITYRLVATRALERVSLNVSLAG